MTTTPHHQDRLGDLAREMDSPATVIWTSIHVIKRCLEQISDGRAAAAAGNTVEEGDSNSVIGQMHRNLDLAIKAGERIVRVNKSLQRAIHLRDESG